MKEGDTVAKGDRIAVVEAMKMEHVLHAARAGRIDKLAVKEGQQVTQGALIASRWLRHPGGCPGIQPPLTPTAGSRIGTGPADDTHASSPDWMRLTPALSMSFQAAASEPCVSMPRQASSIT